MGAIHVIQVSKHVGLNPREGRSLPPRQERSFLLAASGRHACTFLTKFPPFFRSSSLLCQRARSILLKLRCDHEEASGAPRAKMNAAVLPSIEPPRSDPATLSRCFISSLCRRRAKSSKHEGSAPWSWSKVNAKSIARQSNACTCVERVSREQSTELHASGMMCSGVQRVPAHEPTAPQESAGARHWPPGPGRFHQLCRGIPELSVPISRTIPQHTQHSRVQELGLRELRAARWKGPAQTNQESLLLGLLWLLPLLCTFPPSLELRAPPVR